MHVNRLVIIIAVFAFLTTLVNAGGIVARNPPSACQAPDSECNCSVGRGVQNGCVKITLDMGETTPWTGSKQCALKVFSDDLSPQVFTPDSLYAVCGYTFKRIGNEVLADGSTPAEIVLAHPNGESVRFVFADGESIARPHPGFYVPMDERLIMVDAQGWACTHNPVYYDLYETDGTVRRFLATNSTNERGRLISIMNSRGVVTTFTDMGIDIIYGPDGVRQFLTPSHLADVQIVKTGYVVTIYSVREAPTKSLETGLYPLPTVAPVERMSVESVANCKKAIVTIQSGEAPPKCYVFEYIKGDWTLILPSGVEERKECVVEDSRRARTVKEVRSNNKKLLSRDEYNYIWCDWGFAATNHIEGFGATTRTTSWEYYASGNGKGQVKTEIYESGLKIKNTYDNANRIVLQHRSGLGMMMEETIYSYESVDSSDIVSPVDARPRTVVKIIDGVECERTYYVYSSLTNIVEYVGTQGAPFGGTNSLRTVTAFYPLVTGDKCSGRIQSIRHKDGRLDIFEYSLKTNIWTEIVTHLHMQSLEPVSGKTIRDIILTNAQGEMLERRTEVFIGSSWHIVSRDSMTYDEQGRCIRTEDINSLVTTTDWDCCHKVSETRFDGSITTWNYDSNGRMVATSRLIPTTLTNVTWLTTCYDYDHFGRQVAIWTTNLAEYVGVPAMRTAYDALGRVVARIDSLGNEAMTTYDSSGRIVTVHSINGAKSIYTRDAEGNIISVTGCGVTPEFTTHGILADGTRWMKTVTGATADSPRFAMRYENMLGQLVRKEHSGFQGAVLATVYTYDSYGRLVSIASDGEPYVEYTYDTLGTRNASTRMVKSVDEWKKYESSSIFAIIGTDIWQVKTNIMSCSDTSIAPLVTSRSVKLTGLTSQNLACVRTTDVRGNTTEDWSEFIDGAIITKRCVPEATNIISTRLRYGIELETVSLSAVTNTICYDALGRQIVTIDGRGNITRTEYDIYGRQSATINPIGARTTYAYNGFGELIAVTNALGNVIVYEYDLCGRKIYEGGATYPVRYAYDIFGNKVSMTTYRDELQGIGDTTIWHYDESSNCVTNKVYADGKGPSYDYDTNGRLIKRIWARGTETYYSYDVWGNLTNTTYSDDTPSVSLVYDAMGRQKQAIDAAGITTFVYDNFSVSTKEIVISVATTNIIERFTDVFGRDIGYSLNGVRRTRITYDSRTSRLMTMLTTCCKTPFTWTYFEGSDLKSSLIYPNGLVTNWNYDKGEELLIVSNAITNDTISKYDYIYDAVGRCIRCSKSGSVFPYPDIHSYLYNSRSELTNVTSSVDSSYRYNYLFDDIGNRKNSYEDGTNSVYVSNRLNQYVAVDGFVPIYDNDGNQILVKTATGVWTVAYNGENRPVCWAQGTNTVMMSYDRMGRRVMKNNERFVYDGFLQIADNAGNAYVWDPTEPVETRPLVWNHNGNISYYAHDGNKNVCEVIHLNGQVATHCDYAPFGVVLEKKCLSTMVNPWRFSSESADDILGLVYYNYRHYDPISGRWLTREPLEDEERRGQYVFCANSSILRLDILGLKKMDEVCDEDHEYTTRAEYVIAFGIRGENPDYLKRKLNTVITLTLMTDLIGSLDIPSLALADINTILGLYPSGSDVAAELLKNYGKIVKSFMKNEEVEVWSKVQCQKCKCTNYFSSLLGLRKAEYAWKTIDESEWIKCDIRRTLWGRKAVKARASKVNHDGSINYKFLTVKDLQDIRKQCGDQGKKYCEEKD